MVHDLGVAAEEFKEEFGLGILAQVFAGDGDEALEVEFVGVEQQVDHLLFLVGLVAHVGEDDDAGFGGGAEQDGQEQQPEKRGDSAHGVAESSGASEASATGVSSHRPVS